MAVLFNPKADRPARLSPRAAARFSAAAAAAPLTALAACPAHAPTPLLRLDGLAAALGVKTIWWKDERTRMGLTSFKALGGAYAVLRLVLQRVEVATGESPRTGFPDIETLRAAGAGMTVTAATDGNHGLSVAAGARVFGARCVIFVHKRVSRARIRRIQAQGADVRIVDGVFDDAVAEAERTAAREGWALVADTSFDSDDPISGDVVQGYAALAAELDDQLRAAGAGPSHFFVQAGVGGLAAALIAGLADRRGARRPFAICVEPATAPALYGSVAAGRIVRAADAGGTAMEMLDCYAPSALAFEALLGTADAFQTVADETASGAVARLAAPVGADPAITATPTAAAGLAGLIELLADPDAAARAGLGPHSEVVLIGTEAPPPERP